MMDVFENVDQIRAENEKALEDNLIRYSAHCGPRVLGMIKGISALDAAKELFAIRAPGGDWEYTDILTLSKALDKKVESAALNNQRITQHGEVIGLYDKFPTLSKFIEDNKKRIMIVRADHHFALVAFGVIIDKNFENGRARVTHVIYLD